MYTSLYLLFVSTLFQYLVVITRLNCNATRSPPLSRNCGDVSKGSPELPLLPSNSTAQLPIFSKPEAMLALLTKVLRSYG